MNKRIIAMNIEQTTATRKYNLKPERDYLKFGVFLLCLAVIIASIVFFSAMIFGFEPDDQYPYPSTYGRIDPQYRDRYMGETRNDYLNRKRDERTEVWNNFMIQQQKEQKRWQQRQSW